MTKSEIIGFAPIGRTGFVAYTNLAILLAFFGTFLGAGSLYLGAEITDPGNSLLIQSIIEYSLFILAVLFVFKFAIQRFNDLGLKGFAVISYLTPIAPITYLALACLPGGLFSKDKTPRSNAPTMPLILLAILPLFIIVPVTVLGVITFFAY